MPIIRGWRHVRSGKERGYTFIELLIVIAVIGILAAIALPLYATEWTYDYSASGPDTYTFVGTSPTDLPSGNITYP